MNEVREWGCDDAPVQLKEADERGRFLQGSTVVLLWPKDTLRFNPSWAPTGPVRMGEAMARALA